MLTVVEDSKRQLPCEPGIALTYNLRSTALRGFLSGTEREREREKKKKLFVICIEKINPEFLYYFPIAFVTNYPKLHGLNNMCLGLPWWPSGRDPACDNQVLVKPKK